MLKPLAQIEFLEFLSNDLPFSSFIEGLTIGPSEIQCNCNVGHHFIDANPCIESGWHQLVYNRC
jgi:hypothetical protein